MQVKTSELIDYALDWAVAQAEGNVRLQYDSREGLIINNILGWIPYRPSAAWQQGGPIIERERISVEYTGNAGRAWFAKPPGNPTRTRHQMKDGTTPLIAAMRCYVASKLGDDVDVPEELCK